MNELKTNYLDLVNDWNRYMRRCKSVNYYFDKKYPYPHCSLKSTCIKASFKYIKSKLIDDGFKCIYVRNLW